jgi:hypothetical protein
MATQFKKSLKVGQRVKFYRTHDKFSAFTGTISAIADGDDDMVTVKTEAGNGSVSREEQAHAGDVTVLSEAPVGTSTEGNTIRGTRAI